MKVTRPLNEMQEDIAKHEEAIKLIRAEIKVFQSECPHPPNFAKQTSSSTEDEYGRVDGYFYCKTCLLCGHKEYWNTDK